MAEKKWYASKTLWVNALAVVGVFATGLIEYLGAEVSVAVLAGANALLRFVTSTKLIR